MHKILWDFEIRTDIQVRRPDLVLINLKRICHLEDLVVLADHRVKKKSKEKKNKQIARLYLRAEKVEKGDGDTNLIIGIVLENLENKLDELEIRGKIETIQTTALLKSPRLIRKVLEICCHPGGWHYNMPTLVWLFSAKVTPIIIIFNYIWYKNTSSIILNR